MTAPGITPVSFTTVSAAIGAVRADLTAQGYTGQVYLGRQGIRARRDPTAAFTMQGYAPIFGSVVVVPQLRAPSKMGATNRILGGNPRPMFTVARELELHCWSRAPQGPFATQYEADLTAAETLLAAVLRSFEVLVPGTKRGGSVLETYAGDSAAGVELVASITIDLEVVDQTYTLAVGAIYKPNYAMAFPDGTFDSGSDQYPNPTQ